MIFAILTLLTALALAAVAGWFSIIGLMAILAGQPVAALVLGVTLEAGKLVTTSWLYRNWNEASWSLKAPLIYFTIALMVATSMGVFGFLSKAHLEQGASTMDNSSKIERMQQQIARENAIIADNDKVIAQLDATVNSFIGKDRADRALSVRRSQSKQRDQLKADTEAAQKRIEAINDEKFKLESELRKLELEVGPIRYIAELIYGTENSDNKTLESAVRIFTLIIVSTLDPLAITLLIAANFTILRIQNERKAAAKDKSEPTDTPLPLPSTVPVPPQPDIVPNEEKENNKSDWQTWTIEDVATEAQINNSQPEILGKSDASTQQEENIVEKTTNIFPQEPITETERSIPTGVEDGKDSVKEISDIIETQEVGISEEEKAALEEWLQRGKNYAGIRQPTPTSVIADPAAEWETVADIPQTDKTDNNDATLPMEISSGESMVVPWAHRENVYRELVGSAHFVPQKITKVPEEPTIENHEQEADSIKSAKYPKTLSWLTEFRRDQ